MPEKSIEEIVEWLIEELSCGGRGNYLDDTLCMDSVRDILHITLSNERKQRGEENARKVCSQGFNCRATTLKHFINFWHCPTRFHTEDNQK